MKRHLNTLYVTTQGAYLAKDGETVQVRLDGEVKLRVPAHNLEGIVCFGNVGCSPFVLGHCAERDIGVSFLTQNGRFLARVVGPIGGNVLLRREQYRRADDPSGCASIVRSIVLAKLANCRSVLLRAVRDHPDSPGSGEIEEAGGRLKQLLAIAERAEDVDFLRGLEGSAAREYFGCVDRLILQQRDDFPFSGRSRRPPLDRVNALLSFLYTLLTHDIVGGLEGVGLDPAVGFLHRDRPGRPGLALDLLEELRPALADRLALSLINLRQIQAGDFECKENGAVLLSDRGRRTVLVAYQKRKEEVVRHPFLGDKVTVGLIPHLQALLMARYLRGDLDGYPPFLVR